MLNLPTVQESIWPIFFPEYRPVKPQLRTKMEAAPFIVLNGYPGVGKSSVGLALQ